MSAWSACTGTTDNAEHRLPLFQQYWLSKVVPDFDGQIIMVVKCLGPSCPTQVYGPGRLY